MNHRHRARSKGRINRMHIPSPGPRVAEKLLVKGRCQTCGIRTDCLIVLYKIHYEPTMGILGGECRLMCHLCRRHNKGRFVYPTDEQLGYFFLNKAIPA